MNQQSITTKIKLKGDTARVPKLLDTVATLHP